VLEHVEQEYGDGERAHRTAFGVLKRSFQMDKKELARAIAKKQERLKWR